MNPLQEKIEPMDIEVNLAPEGTPMAAFQKERTDAISEMFDGKYDNGIYPTSRFFARLDKCVEEILKKEKEIKELHIEKIKSFVKEILDDSFDSFSIIEESGAGKHFAYHEKSPEIIKEELKETITERLTNANWDSIL